MNISLEFEGSSSINIINHNNIGEVLDLIHLKSSSTQFIKSFHEKLAENFIINVGRKILKLYNLLIA